MTSDSIRTGRPLGRLVTALVLLVETVVLVLVGGADVFGDATAPETWASGLVWLVAGLFAGYLAIGLLRPSTVDPLARLGWWVLIVQLATVTLLYYGYWVESTSQVDRWSWVILGALVVPVVVGLVSLLAVRRRAAPADPTGGRADWRAALTEGRLQALAALIGVIGSASVLVVEKVYLPNHDVPTINVAATLTQLGRTGDDVLLQGTITIANNGPAPASVLGSLYRITGHAFSDPSPADVDAVTAAINGAGPNTRRYPQPEADIAGRRVLQADDVLAVTDVLLPGEVITRSFTFQGSAAAEDFARLDADLVVMTGRLAAGATRECAQQADRVGRDPTGYASVCWENDIPARNALHRLFDDDLRVQSVVLVRGPGLGSVPLPYLYSNITVAGTQTVDRTDLWLGNFIAQVKTQAEFAYTVDSAGPQPSR